MSTGTLSINLLAAQRVAEERRTGEERGGGRKWRRGERKDNGRGEESRGEEERRRKERKGREERKRGSGRGEESTASCLAVAGSQGLEEQLKEGAKKGLSCAHTTDSVCTDSKLQRGAIIGRWVDEAVCT